MDMLRAARNLLRDNNTGHTLSGDVMVTGFSQGASAALGLPRALGDNAEPWFRLRAIAPISGAYAFRYAEIPALLGGELDPKISVAYTAYLLVAWNRLHHPTTRRPRCSARRTTRPSRRSSTAITPASSS
jgi:predicted esterase